jgi:hypothetical protein
MGDETIVKTALTLLASQSSADNELGLIQLQNVTGSRHGVKLLASRDNRRRICAFASTGGLRANGFVAEATLRVLTAIVEFGHVAGKGVYNELTTRPLIVLLKRASATPASLTQACELLLLLARHTRRFELTMRLDGGVEALCALLQSGPEAPLLRAATELLTRCCIENENSIRIAQKKGAVRAAISALRVRNGSALVCSPLLALLAVLCEGSRGRAVLAHADDDPYDMIVHVIRRHSDNEDVMASGLTLIHSLSGDPAVAAKLCDASAFIVGWSAVVRHVGNPTVLRQVRRHDGGG